MTIFIRQMRYKRIQYVEEEEKRKWKNDCIYHTNHESRTHSNFFFVTHTIKRIFYYYDYFFILTS